MPPAWRPDSVGAVLAAFSLLPWQFRRGLLFVIHAASSRRCSVPVRTNSPRLDCLTVCVSVRHQENPANGAKVLEPPHQ